MKSFDPAPAKAVARCEAVVQVPSGVAVVAENFWAAKPGRDALDGRVGAGPGRRARQPTALREQFRRPEPHAGRDCRARQAISRPKVRDRAALEVEYDVPYLAHATMEPLNCTVRLSEGRARSGSERSSRGLDQQAAAEVAGLQPEQVTIHTTFLGGGFGRRAHR